MSKVFDFAENKRTFIELVNTNIKRDGIDSFLDYLVNKSDFFIAPASSRHHLAVPGGLCQHSLNVYYRLIKEIEMEFGSIEASPFSIETISIVTLFHDVCKIDYYQLYQKNVKNEDTGKWEKVDAYKVNDTLPIPHSFKSQYIVRSYINLSREESIAIMSHMGPFDSTFKGGDSSVCDALEKYKLALLTHVSDLKASYIDEKD